jgi:superfamily II DNA or RNA helicase
MPSSASDLFIVDNSDRDWKVRSYLAEWCAISSAIDIATGFFEVGGLLCLDDKWQQVDRIRILMGDEVSFRTKRAFQEGLQRITQRLDESLEGEKRKNDFLTGMPAIVAALRSGKIQCRVYRRDRFHAKAYLTHARTAVIGSYALVGSSNLTYPGLTENVELNVQIRGTDVRLLQEWYERHWNDAEDVTADILRTCERHTRDYSPFELWFKALDEFLRGHELTPDGWDKTCSRVFPVLDQYQRDAYRNLLRIAATHRLAFLCDGVGLGKTYVGLMLLERLVVRDGLRVVLFAPKAAREDVWERAIPQQIPDLNSGFVNLVIYNHTDLQRKGKWPRDMALTLRDADAVIIDEAHHFRNPGIKGEGDRNPSRYRLLQRYLRSGERPKQLYLLTATPVNNSIHDFRHMVELLTGDQLDYFARDLGIHNLRSHFVALERGILKQLPGNPALLDVETGADILAVDKALGADRLFSALVVQRSRAYVKQSQLQAAGNQALFPERGAPQVVPYNLKKTYGELLASVEQAFNKQRPLFVLGVYNPLSYWQGDKSDPAFQTFEAGRQQQVVALIRTLFLKRFESSAKAFEGSCWRLLQKLLAWVTVHATDDHCRRALERWRTKHADLIGYVHAHQLELWPENADDDEVEDILSDELLDGVDRLDAAQFDLPAIFHDTLDDLTQLAEFLALLAKVTPARDDKLKALIKLLKSDAVLDRHKVLLFTEFAETARYLEQQLAAAGIAGVHRIDGGSTQRQRSDVIERFAPYYNGTTSAQLAAAGRPEIRVLISTDVLSEGLNLQDATRLINYDLHWNPVRLMQRIGRVDRRLNPAVESALLGDHPELAGQRGTVAFWNFLPPAELDHLLRLFQRVTSKTLVISRSFGIEGCQLLTPDDAFDPVREINERFDGTLSETEQLRLEYQQLLAAYPELADRLPAFPLKTFSGRASPRPETRAVFFCYRIPRPDPALVPGSDGEPRWSDTAGLTVWACADLQGDRLLTEPGPIANLIRATPDTPRRCTTDQTTLIALRQKLDKRLTADYLRPLQAPPGVSPILKCWLELN